MPAGRSAIDFYEVEPATLALDALDVPSPGDDPLLQLAAHGRPVITHGVTAPVGGTVAANGRERAALATAAARVASPWVSEHLSIDRFRGQHGEVVPTGFFLPPLQTPQTVENAAAQLGALADAVQRPVAFETGVNYLRPVPGELTDGSFFAAVAEAADCYILCDLHNLWCNEQNGRQPVLDVVRELPVERVVEVHLAGGQRHGTFLLDAHADLVDPDLDAIALKVIEGLPALRAITFELMPDYVAPRGIDASAYRQQLERLHALWDARGRRAVRAGARPRGHVSDRCRFDPTTWEAALAEALEHQRGPLAHDPGIGVYRHLIGMIRAGTAVAAMPLTYRLIALHEGLDRATAILDSFRASVGPSAWPVDEARALGAFLRAEILDVPYLGAVIDFELAAHTTALTGQPQRVTFPCDPGPLLDALRRGLRPPSLETLTVEVTVTP